MKRIILLCLSLFLCLTALCGCSEETVQNDKYPAKLSGEYTLFDYESYGNNFEIIFISDYFGKISVNENKDYVKTGEQSMQIEPYGSTVLSDKPFFVLPLISDRFDFDYSDFNDIYSIKCSIYNSSELDVNLSIGLTQTADKEKLSAFFESYKLKNGWNEIEYVIWDGANLDKVSGVYFSFDNYAFYKQESPKIFLDDFILNQKDGIVRNLTYYEREETELIKIRDFSSLDYFSVAGWKYSPTWVSDADLQQLKGDSSYEGKALQYNVPLHVCCIKVKPRIDEKTIKEYYSEGYSKITFWVNAIASNGKTIQLISDSSIYTSSVADINGWTKVKVELNEKNINKLFDEEGFIRLTGFYLQPGTDGSGRLNLDGTTATMTIYLGDVSIEK